MLTHETEGKLQQTPDGGVSGHDGEIEEADEGVL